MNEHITFNSTLGPVSLPLPLHTVAYSVIETEVAIDVVAALKTPDDESALAVLRRARNSFPNLPWSRAPGWQCRGHSGGSGNPYEVYRLDKREGGFYITDAAGDMRQAFTSPLREGGGAGFGVTGDSVVDAEDTSPIVRELLAALKGGHRVNPDNAGDAEVNPAA